MSKLSEFDWNVYYNQQPHKHKWLEIPCSYSAVEKTEQTAGELGLG